MIARLSDMLNAEIVLGTVNSVSDAMTWLGYTYLCVRMLRARANYQIAPDVAAADPLLEGRRADLIHTACMQLDKGNLIKYDKKSGLHNDLHNDEENILFLVLIFLEFKKFFNDLDYDKIHKMSTIYPAWLAKSQAAVTADKWKKLNTTIAAADADFKKANTANWNALFPVVIPGSKG